MPINSIVTDPSTGVEAKVTTYGQLVVAPIAYDEVSYQGLAVADTAYNFYGPKTGKRFVITTIRVKVNRNVSNTVDAEIVIYQATAPDTTTVFKDILHEEMVRGNSVSLATNLIIDEGLWVNGKTSDATVHVNIFGYYVSAS